MALPLKFCYVFWWNWKPGVLENYVGNLPWFSIGLGPSNSLTLIFHAYCMFQFQAPWSPRPSGRKFVWKLEPNNTCLTIVYGQSIDLPFKDIPANQDHNLLSNHTSICILFYFIFLFLEQMKRFIARKKLQPTIVIWSYWVSQSLHCLYQWFPL